MPGGCCQAMFSPAWRDTIGTHFSESALTWRDKRANTWKVVAAERTGPGPPVGSVRSSLGRVRPNDPRRDEYERQFEDGHLSGVRCESFYPRRPPSFID